MKNDTVMGMVVSLEFEYEEINKWPSLKLINNHKQISPMLALTFTSEYKLYLSST